MKKKIFTSAVYIIFLFIFLEFGSRVILKLYHPEPNCDAVWRLMWKKRYQAHRTEAYNSFEAYDPTKGWVLRPNLNEPNAYGEGKSLHSNSKGIRANKEMIR